jgi:hypothetical protein
MMRKLFYILTALLLSSCGPHRMVVEHAEFQSTNIRIGTTWKEYTY